MIIQYTQRTMVMTVLETLTVLFKSFTLGLFLCCAVAYAENSNQDWCDPRFCCPPKVTDES